MQCVMSFLDLPAARFAEGVVRLPGSKSISNRVLLLAALAALESDDIEAVDASPIISSDPLGPSRRRYANAVALVASVAG